MQNLWKRPEASLEKPIFLQTQRVPRHILAGDEGANQYLQDVRTLIANYDTEKDAFNVPELAGQERVKLLAFLSVSWNIITRYSSNAPAVGTDASAAGINSSSANLTGDLKKANADEPTFFGYPRFVEGREPLQLKNKLLSQSELPQEIRQRIIDMDTVTQEAVFSDTRVRSITIRLLYAYEKDFSRDEQFEKAYQMLYQALADAAVSPKHFAGNIPFDVEISPGFGGYGTAIIFMIIDEAIKKYAAFSPRGYCRLTAGFTKGINIKNLNEVPEGLSPKKGAVVEPGFAEVYIDDSYSIFYNHNSLRPGHPVSHKQDLIETIAHENIHNWFISNFTHFLIESCPRDADIYYPYKDGAMDKNYEDTPVGIIEEAQKAIIELPAYLESFRFFIDKIAAHENLALVNELDCVGALEPELEKTIASLEVVNFTEEGKVFFARCKDLFANLQQQLEEIRHPSVETLMNRMFGGHFSGQKLSFGLPLEFPTLGENSHSADAAGVNYLAMMFKMRFGEIDSKDRAKDIWDAMWKDSATFHSGNTVSVTAKEDTMWISVHDEENHSEQGDRCEILLYNDKETGERRIKIESRESKYGEMKTIREWEDKKVSKPLLTFIEHDTKNNILRIYLDKSVRMKGIEQENAFTIEAWTPWDSYNDMPARRFEVKVILTRPLRDGEKPHVEVLDAEKKPEAPKQKPGILRNDVIDAKFRFVDEEPKALPPGKPAEAQAVGKTRLIITDNADFYIGARNIKNEHITLLKISPNGSKLDLGLIRRVKKSVNPDEVYTYFTSPANKILKLGSIQPIDLTPKGDPESALAALRSL